MRRLDLPHVAALAAWVLCACQDLPPPEPEHGGVHASPVCGDPTEGGGAPEDGGAPPSEYSELPTSREAAARFLTQATFGPTPESVDRLMAMGYQAWLTEQFAMPQASHRLAWEEANRRIKERNPAASAGQRDLLDSFWKQTLTGQDQLRQRVAFALSEIFVISMQDTSVGESVQGAAAYLDMLGDKGFTNYRELLETVTLHPAMGMYLTHIRNQKENLSQGRQPDQNFAREVLQLFSIGLHLLNPDGTPLLDAEGKLQETFGPNDIKNLARVFTGWSWACPAGPDINCFFGGKTLEGEQDPARLYRSLRSYPQYHSRLEKRFLSVVIPAQEESNPEASLRAALDGIFQHPNVGPFFSRLLIQRLVTSHPSPDYVFRVASVFANNGAGVRGDLKAVIRAVLLDPEARDAAKLSDPTFGKPREPLVRLATVLRATRARSDSGLFLVGCTADPGTSLGMSPMKAPSVFNFYRHDYIPPNTRAGARGLTVPEMQLTHETTMAGYVNFTRDLLRYGSGMFGVDGSAPRRDLQPDFLVNSSALELQLAETPAALVEYVNQQLLYGQMPDALRQEVTAAVSSFNLPAPTGSNQAQIEAARRNRVSTAFLLTAVSPEFLIQK